MSRPCQECGRQKGRGGALCARCYQARYRQDPAVRARHRAAVKAFAKAHPEQRREWVRTMKLASKVRAETGLAELPPEARAAIRALAELGPRRSPKRESGARLEPESDPNSDPN